MYSTLPRQALPGRKGRRTSALSPVATQAACRSNTSASSQTLERSASVITFIAGVTYMPSRTVSEETTPS